MDVSTDMGTGRQAERDVPEGEMHAAEAVQALPVRLRVVDSPSSLRRLPHVVAGHTVQGKSPMLGAGGVLYKPVQVRCLPGAANGEVASLLMSPSVRALAPRAPASAARSAASASVRR